MFPKEEEYKLDNPVWYALWEVHDQQAALFPYMQAYLPEFASFVASLQPQRIANSLEIYTQLSPRFYFVGDQPVLPPTLNIADEVICEQMVWEKTALPYDTSAVQLLDEQHTAQIVELVQRVQPGYIKEKTPLLGNYFGIFEEGRLAAVAGQRMQLNYFTEISACVTDPAFRGKGYQQKLITRVIEDILETEKWPFLHVVSSNHQAVQLYEKMGFSSRRKISFWKIQ